MDDPPSLPYQTIVREYKGTESVARGLAAIDAERLAERGWQVESTSWLDKTKERGCVVTLIQLAFLHYTIPSEEKHVIRVRYALGVKREE